MKPTRGEKPKHQCPPLKQPVPRFTSASAARAQRREEASERSDKEAAPAAPRPVNDVRGQNSSWENDPGMALYEDIREAFELEIEEARGARKILVSFVYKTAFWPWEKLPEGYRQVWRRAANPF